MSARLDLARIEYHHWIYEVAVFQETQVLEILTEYMSSYHSNRRSSIGLDHRILSDLENLRKQMSIRRLERESQKLAMEDHRRRLVYNLSKRIPVDPPWATVQPIEPTQPTGLNPTPKSTGLIRSSSANEHSLIHSNFPYRNQIGGKLRGFALTLTGKSFGSDETHHPSIPHDRHLRQSTLGSSLGLLSHPISADPIDRDDQTMVQDDHHPSNHPNDHHPSAPMKMRSWSENVQRNQEGFLLSYTKSLAAGGSQRNQAPRDQSQQGTGGISSGDASKSWKKLWCVLAAGELREYKGDELIQVNRSSIDLRYAMVRERKGKTERKFCFEVVTIKFVRVYQAFSHDQMLEWIAAIESSIESLLNTRTTLVKPIDQSKPPQSSTGSRKLRKPTLTLPKFKGGGLKSRDEITANFSSTNQSTTHLDIRPSLEHQAAQTLEIEWNSTGLPLGQPRSSYDQSPHWNRIHPHPDQLNLTSRWKLLGNPDWSEQSPINKRHGHRFEEDFDALTRPIDCRFDLSNSIIPSGSLPTADQVLEAHLDRSNPIDRPVLPGHQVGHKTSADRPEESIDRKDEGMMYEKNFKELDQLSKLSKCAECGVPKPRWASYSLGILICINCSGIHRGLGTHISKVRSLDLDDWNDDQIKLVKEIGNEKSKAIWEAKLPENWKLDHQNLKEFIFDKYALKKYRDDDDRSPTS